MPAVQEIIPQAEHRCCARHIYANWRKLYPGQALKILFWKASKSNNPADFRRAMSEIRKESQPAHAALLKHPPRIWSRAYFRTESKCDVVTNNMSECFNSWILEARYKPLLTMLEDIKTQVMGRIHSKRDEMLKKEGNLCPRILKKLNKAVELTRYCDHEWDGEHGFEVSDKNGKYKVDLLNKTCSCGVWQLSGIPCHHGATGILFMERPLEEFVSPWYYKDTYLKSYHHLLKPMSGKNDWPETNYQKLLPPIAKRVAGRPKKNRRKDASEEPKNKKKVSRKGTQIQCSKCKEYGHNKLGCKNIAPAPSQTSKLPVSFLLLTYIQVS